MLKNNIKTAFRNMRRYKSSFLINLFSLSVGLAGALLIYLWVLDEVQMNRFHDKGDRLVHILQNVTTSDGIYTGEHTQAPLATAMLEAFPEVEQVATVVPSDLFQGEKFMLSDGEEQFFNAQNQFASADYFDMFDYDFLEGTPQTALTSKYSIVLSEGLAQKLFPSEKAIGKTVEWIHDEFGGLYKVSGVFRVPQHSSESFDAMFNIDILLEEYVDEIGWGNSDFYTYASLAAGTDLDQFNTKIENFVATQADITGETLFAQPHSDHYLYGQYENGAVSGGRIAYVRLLSIVGIFLLLIGCINFMNMSTAKGTKKIKEIGVKKVIGATRKSLIAQYVTEAILITSLAALTAIALVVLLLPQFNIITGKTLQLSFDPIVVGSILGITVLTSLIASSYPAMYLSGFKPIQSLQGKSAKSWSALLTRKGLIVFQFAISTVLLVFAILVYQQIGYIQSKNLGYERDNRIQFKMGIRETGRTEGERMSAEEIESFLQRVKNTAGVENATNFAYFLSDFGTTTGLTWDGKPVEEDVIFANVAGGYDFIETMGIQMKAGRPYAREFKTDNEKIIFNETAIEAMGIENPIGKVVNLWGDDKKIVGVVEDFHFATLYEDIQPFFLNLTTSDFAYNVIVKLEAGNEVATIDRLQQAYQDYFINGMPFEFQFLEETYAQLYEQETRISSLSKYFVSTAIFISCLGLFGFASFSLKQRTKEIGIRKVLGASVTGIVALLSKDFIQLVGIAFLIATPIAYYFMNEWLQDFAYRIELQWWIFAAAGLVAIGIALLTVSVQSVRAALANPVKSLRNE
ncbi:MAG: ABC transporter permease [Bacteroidota bacterium]